MEKKKCFFLFLLLQLSAGSLSHGEGGGWEGWRGCHRDRRPHVLGASVLVKGDHCSCVKPSSLWPSARGWVCVCVCARVGGGGFTALTGSHTHCTLNTNPPATCTKGAQHIE